MTSGDDNGTSLVCDCLRSGPRTPTRRVIVYLWRRVRIRSAELARLSRCGERNEDVTESSAKEDYSDGNVEDDLLAYFEGRKPFPDPSTWDWPHRYHLSPLRSNLVSWIEFQPGEEVLEVGAGCGAITAALALNDIRLTALELTERRTAINRARNRHHENVSFIQGNVESLDQSKLFDTIVCVGVLEYSGTYIDGTEPYLEFLRILKRQLKPGGRLLLAIENRFGLKYWSGAKEDHTASLFEGIEGYPGPRRVQTFSKKQLAALITASGLPHQYFYYPFPDYKLPKVVYGEAAFQNPDLTSLVGAKFVPAPAFDQTRHHFFSEQMAAQQLIESELLDEFANSFLVEASDQSLGSTDQIAAALPQPSRKPAYQLTTVVSERNGEVVVRKMASGESQHHLRLVVENHAELVSRWAEVEGVSAVDAGFVGESEARFTYQPGPTLESALNQRFMAQDLDAALQLIDKYLAVIERLEVHGSSPAIDFIFDNLILAANEELVFVDDEWRQDLGYSWDLVAARALLTHIARFQSMFVRLSESVQTVRVGDLVFPDALHARFRRLVELFPMAQRLESQLQLLVEAGRPDIQAIPIVQGDPVPYVVRRLLNDAQGDLNTRLAGNVEELVATQNEHVQRIDNLLEVQREHVERIDHLTSEVLRLGDELGANAREVEEKNRAVQIAAEREAAALAKVQDIESGRAYRLVDRMNAGRQAIQRRVKARGR